MKMPNAESMKAKLESKIKKLGVFTKAQAEAIGLSHQRLSELVEAERISRVGHGLYLHSEAENLDRGLGFQIACKKFVSPAAVGGLSALFHYNLAEQVPAQVWMIVPPDKKSYDPLYKLIRTQTPLDCQVKEENGYRIVTIERAIIEGLNYVKKIGERTAVKAARDAIASKETNEVKLGKAAKELGLTSIVAKYLEVIIP